MLWLWPSSLTSCHSTLPELTGLSVFPNSPVHSPRTFAQTSNCYASILVFTRLASYHSSQLKCHIPDHPIKGYAVTITSPYFNSLKNFYHNCLFSYGRPLHSHSLLSPNRLKDHHIRICCLLGRRSVSREPKGLTYGDRSMACVLEVSP